MTNKLLKKDEFINTKLVNQKNKCYEELNKYIKGDYNSHIMNNLRPSGVQGYTKYYLNLNSIFK